MIYPLDSFGPEFWKIDNEPCVLGPGVRPATVEQALWEIGIDNWQILITTLFPHRCIIDVGIDEVMEIIKKTNTCSNLDSPVEVWIDRKGDFKIKVYNVC